VKDNSLIFITKQQIMKKFLNEVKEWVAANGITGIGFGLAGIYFLINGQNLFAGIGLGVLFTRNWDWVVSKFKSLFNK